MPEPAPSATFPKNLPLLLVVILGSSDREQRFGGPAFVHGAVPLGDAPTGTLMTKINRQLTEVSTPPSTGPADDAMAPPIAQTAIACARARGFG
jgi:hypothetical protein